MSAIGTKRTFRRPPSMSAIGVRADIDEPPADRPGSPSFLVSEFPLLPREEPRRGRTRLSPNVNSQSRVAWCGATPTPSSLHLNFYRRWRGRSQHAPTSADGFENFIGRAQIQKLRVVATGLRSKAPRDQHAAQYGLTTGLNENLHSLSDPRSVTRSCAF